MQHLAQGDDAFGDTRESATFSSNEEGIPESIVLDVLSVMAIGISALFLVHLLCPTRLGWRPNLV
jgi:hypothetical protein